MFLSSILREIAGNWAVSGSFPAVLSVKWGILAEWAGLLDFDALVAEEFGEGFCEVVGGFDAEGEADGTLAGLVF